MDRCRLLHPARASIVPFLAIWDQNMPHMEAMWAFCAWCSHGGYMADAAGVRAPPPARPRRRGPGRRRSPYESVSVPRVAVAPSRSARPRHGRRPSPLAQRIIRASKPAAYRRIPFPAVTARAAVLRGGRAWSSAAAPGGVTWKAGRQAAVASPRLPAAAIEELLCVRVGWYIDRGEPLKESQSPL
eukprot:scaffold2639_cov385-Prasinococcus_capsulatus_cf.AAC.13